VKNEKCGIYVHIPFCIKKCNYCDFNSYASCFEKEQLYFDALIKEIKIKGEEFKNCNFDTVYIGGGTPTSVKSDNIVRLMKEVKNNFSIDKDSEITIECNPGTAKKEDFEKYISSGINRLSVGLQTTDESLLKKLGRIHTLSEFENCLALAKKSGFKNISADLMFGLPDQSLNLWEETLLKVMQYDLSHISCYALKVEEGTPFYNQNLNLPDEDLSADMYEKGCEILEKNGFLRYEISNFAKKGKESRHNLKYWSQIPYLGLGAGAYSFVNCERFSNTLKIDDYILAVGNGNIEKEDYISLSEPDMMSEFIFMGLRKISGISKSDFSERFGKSIFDVFDKPLKKYLNNGVLIENGDRIYIYEKMLYISNTILCDFV